MNGFNPQNLMNLFQQFRQNPMQFMAKKGLNLPKEYMDNPQGAVQYLMDSGKMSQIQYNQFRQLAKQFSGNNNI